MADEDQDVKLFNANDGITGRDGGPYADLEDARDAETLRARIEGRDPNYDLAQNGVGITTVTATQVIANGYVPGSQTADADTVEQHLTDGAIAIVAPGDDDPEEDTAPTEIVIPEVPSDPPADNSGDGNSNPDGA